MIDVWSPNFWWRTTVSVAREWVEDDPDVADGRQRHQDRDSLRWDLIATAVSRVGDALSAGQWMKLPGDDEYGVVRINGYPAGLVPTEQSVVSAWFSKSQRVSFDPWWKPIADGRHRLWGALPHFGDSLIPICSDSLAYAISTNTSEMGPTWAAPFVDNLVALDACKNLDVTDPLNSRLRKAVAMAAAGRNPPQN